MTYSIACTHWRNRILSEPSVNESFAVDELNDQHWRRLGITQTFERLLVEAVARAPGTTEEIRDRAGLTLGGGAKKFWEMSFPQMLKDLCRRGALSHAADHVCLSEQFAERVRNLLVSQQAGHSRVAPTPGVTLEDIVAQAEARKAREEADKTTARKRPSRAKSADSKKSTRASSTKAAPLKRSANSDDDEPAKPVRPAAPVPRTLTPADKLFTSMRLNRLLDALDTGSLSKPQLGSRLTLSGMDLAEFFEVSDALGLTRTKEDLVELHWQGRELARTSDADRRMALRNTVKTLREKASELRKS